MCSHCCHLAMCKGIHVPSRLLPFKICVRAHLRVLLVLVSLCFWSAKLIFKKSFKVSFEGWFLLPKKFGQARGSQSVAPELPVPASPGSLWEMRVLESHLRPTNSETLGGGATVCVLASPPGDSDICWSLRASELGKYECRFLGLHSVRILLYTSRDDSGLLREATDWVMYNCI